MLFSCETEGLAGTTHVAAKSRFHPTTLKMRLITCHALSSFM